MPGRDDVDPLAPTALPPSDPQTQVSLPPAAKSIRLPTVSAIADPPTRAWMIAVAVIAGAATSLALAYALR